MAVILNRVSSLEEKI